MARNATDVLVMLDAQRVERMPTRQKLKRRVELAFLADGTDINGTVTAINQRTAFPRSVARHIPILVDISLPTAILNDASLRNAITIGDP